jgi:calcineurin-like phosphoesterase family protein
MLKIEDATDFFVTSDTWFGRPNILQIGKRSQWSDVSKMNSAMIKMWNSTVKKDDLVIHLGNFAWDPMTAKHVLDRINGRIIFLQGSSDDALIEVYEMFEQIEVVSRDIVTVPEHDLVLCHYPLSMWPGKDSGTVHLHGHAVFSHPTNLKLEKRINMCCDHWGHRPIKLSTLKDLMNEE